MVIRAHFSGHVAQGIRGDEEVMGRYSVEGRDAEGQVVVDFAKRMDMAVVNTYFTKEEEHKVTYKSGCKYIQVDDILCSKVRLKEIGDCKVITEESVVRLHRMVACRMTLESKKRGSVRARPKWWRLKKENCMVEFREELRQALGGSGEVQNSWATTAEVVRETAREVPWTEEAWGQGMRWWNEEVQERIQRRRW